MGKGGGRREEERHAGAPSSFTNQTTQISLTIHPPGFSLCGEYLATCTEAPMHGHGPGQRARLTPSKKVGLVLEKEEQAEASTLLHESSNSEPETI